VARIALIGSERTAGALIRHAGSVHAPVRSRAGPFTGQWRQSAPISRARLDREEWAVESDGNGWVHCELGHRHWGVHGAAGLLLVRGGGPAAEVLLQHRAPWTNNGDTWALPGGARDSHESPARAALREACEEAGIAPAAVEMGAEYVDDHGGWSYTTVVARAVAPIVLVPNDESLELRWVAVAAITDLDLHPGFADTWPVLLERGLL
jgi:8-oxo-dGTP diphosphatase